MENAILLTRSEMKNLKAGCGLLHNGEWTCGWTVDQAQYAWDEFGGTFYDAYCCASCGGPGFEGAADCDAHALPLQN
jgi:hypothetical protein